MSEQQYEYKHEPYTESEQKALARASRILEKRIRTIDAFTSPDLIRKYLRYRVAHLEHEIFGVLMLDNRNRLIADVELFRGDICGCTVHPREVVKEVLKYNAAAVCYYHPHPSSLAIPSDADIALTKKLQKLLDTIDVRSIDHFIVGNPDITSLQERGLM